LKHTRATVDAAKVIESSQYLTHVYRRVYLDMYKLSNLGPTATGLELGAGKISFAKEIFPNLIVSQGHIEGHNDTYLVKAESLPFANESFEYVIAKDALHHFRNPGKALEEIHRVLKQDGVFLVAEPYWSILGRVIFKFFHPENWDTKSNNLELQSDDPWESNQALLYILSRKRKPVSALLSGFSLELGQSSYALSYALSGGVFSRNRIPDKFLIKLNDFERKFCRLNKVFFGLSITAVFRKSDLTHP
jgi:ubiquinone/menaquinone biosynthesis C-methylase UbiE